jgi:hypothetical protein
MYNDIGSAYKVINLPMMLFTKNEKLFGLLQVGILRISVTAKLSNLLTL